MMSVPSNAYSRHILKSRNYKLTNILCLLSYYFCIMNEMNWNGNTEYVLKVCKFYSKYG